MCKQYACYCWIAIQTNDMYVATKSLTEQENGIQYV